MKAAQISSYGGPEVLSVSSDAARPKRGEAQLLVEVRAASLNPVDIAVRSGMMHQMLPLQFPATMGGDFAGIVVEPGPAGSAFTDRCS